ncbi:hypothetical protein QYM36_015772 [Artemia franciscana]|uniref:Uncharacterized protein n=1 Tax=Artemia franciscana TaxID=6661 RepID=A0AA88KXB2_ARTSF|nr:hypothetical protein QYM36_015772 [Artemia franciscana]
MPSLEVSLKPHPKTTYAVVLKNPPKELVDPKEHRAFIDNLCGGSKISIVELRAGRETWCLVVSDISAASAIANSIKAKDESLKPQLKIPIMYGIARFYPENVTKDQLCDLVTNCIKASRIAGTRFYKPQFSCRDDLIAAMSAPVAFEYEWVHVEEFVPLPPPPPGAMNVRHMVIYLPPVRLLPVFHAVDKKDTPANMIFPA